jgi:hypothetical protein
MREVIKTDRYSNNAATRYNAQYAANRLNEIIDLAQSLTHAVVGDQAESVAALISAAEHLIDELSGDNYLRPENFGS